MPFEKQTDHLVLRSDFNSRGLKCGGRLFLPDVSGRPPVIVMAHGFGAEMSFGLPNFAERFASRGLAVFMFDYRNFGESEGKPRNLVSPRRHLQDWRAALEHVRGLSEVNGRVMGLWGSSFSGGHVLVTAARDGHVRAAAIQVPFVDGLASLKALGAGFALRASIEGLKDLTRAAAGREPHYTPIASSPRIFGVLNRADAEEGYLALVPPGSNWKNRCPARVLLRIPFYRPIRAARKVGCPVLAVMAEKDNYIPPEAVKETARLLKNPELMSLPVGHFEVYSGEAFEKTVSRQADFFVQHLME